MSGRPLRNAVVAGGSIAGLLAARVLSNHFEAVTLVERDALAHTPQPRKGVPQGPHAHILLLRGQAIMRSMFPGLAEGLCQIVERGRKKLRMSQCQAPTPAAFRHASNASARKRRYVRAV